MIIECSKYGYIYEDGFTCQFREKTKINRLSQEGLCFNCEVRDFPERYHACGFCKRPLKYKFSCSICTDGFNEWIKSQIHPTDTQTAILRTIGKSILNVPLEMLNNMDNKHFIIRTKDSFFKWPGFYAGPLNDVRDNQYMPRWIIPKLSIASRSSSYTIKLSMKYYETLLIDILKSNHIDIYAHIQIDISELDESQIKTINSHDTRYIKTLQ